MENLGFCLTQAGLIDEFSNTHRDGLGYTDVFHRQDNPISISDKKILISALEHALSGFLSEFTDVYTGYSSYRERCEHTRAFAHDEDVVLFFETTENYLSRIWLTLDIGKDSDISTAKNMLCALSSLGELIIVDWGWSFIEQVSNDERIEDYLQKRLKAFTDMRRGLHGEI
jgi:hypothetical protein